MQYKLEIQNNKGVVLKRVEIEGGSMAGLNEWFHRLLDHYPTGIYLKIEVTRPDPEVVKIKSRMLSMLNAHHATDTHHLVETLFNNFDINLKGKSDV